MDYKNPLLVKVDAPIGDTPPGRGFYQIEEDSLYVPVGSTEATRKPFSYLDGEYVQMDFDRMGRLMLIEVGLSRRSWQIEFALRLDMTGRPEQGPA